MRACFSGPYGSRPDRSETEGINGAANELGMAVAVPDNFLAMSDSPTAPNPARGSASARSTDFRKLGAVTIKTTKSANEVYNFTSRTPKS
jgi:hypothetical protein